jgi:hypothetical protein
VVSISNGIQVTGRVRFEGPKPENLRETWVSLRPLNEDNISEGRQADGGVKEDGSFVLEHVFDGAYWVTVGFQSVGSGYHLKSAYAGTVDCAYEPLRVNGGVPGPLEIVVIEGNATLSGMVKDSKGDPVPAAIILVLDEYAARRKRMVTFPVQSDIKGLFTVQGLPPGNFYVVALPQEEIEWEGSASSFDFEYVMKALSKQVRLEAAGRANIELTLATLRR